MRCNAAPYEGIEKYIFASFYEDDDVRVYPFIEEMASKGCRVWFDEGVVVSDEWESEINRRIDGCETFVSFLTEKSISTHSCRREINYAAQKGKNIIFLFLEDVVLSPAMRLLQERCLNIYKSTFATAEAFIASVLCEESVVRCTGDFRPNIKVSNLNPGLDSDKTLTLTMGISSADFSRKETFIYRVSNGEKIYLLKNSYSLGRSKEHADYQIEGNRTISRNHATIKTVDGSYFIVDNESLNHTIINGRIIEPLMEHEITGSDTISLGKELFLFFKNYDESDVKNMPEYVLVSANETINIKNDPVVTVRDIIIMNSGKAYYLVSGSFENNIYHNGQRVYYGEKKRLQNGDVITSGSERFVWRLML